MEKLAAAIHSFSFSVAVFAAAGWLSASAAEVRYLAAEGDDAADGITPATAWRTIERLNHGLPVGGIARLRRGDVFYGGIKVKGGPDAGHRTTIADYGEGPKPVISCVKIVKPEAWRVVSISYQIWKANIADSTNYTGLVSSNCNPGFLVVDGEVQAWRKFSRHDVNEQWDFAEEEGWLYVHSTNNPARLAKEIQVAVNVHGVQLDSHTAVSNVCVRATGAHGMHGGWGGVLEDIVIADCDFENIGGSELTGYSKDIRVRYGNGIELGDGCNRAIIERCTFRGVYDVAFTMQGRPVKSGGWRDVVCRDCTMIDCTQAFEIWCGTAPKGIGFERCAFVSNHTVRVGGGWGAVTRPNRYSATPLLLYGIHTDTVDITISGNVFEGMSRGLVFSSAGPGKLPPGYRIQDNVIKP